MGVNKPPEQWSSDVVATLHVAINRRSSGDSLAPVVRAIRQMEVRSSAEADAVVEAFVWVHESPKLARALCDLLLRADPSGQRLLAALTIAVESAGSDVLRLIHRYRKRLPKELSVRFARRYVRAYNFWLLSIGQYSSGMRLNRECKRLLRANPEQA